MIKKVKNIATYTKSMVKKTHTRLHYCYDTASRHNITVPLLLVIMITFREVYTALETMRLLHNNYYLVVTVLLIQAHAESKKIHVAQK